MKTDKKAYERILLILTIISEVLAYGMALVMRYVILNPLYTNPKREYGFYRIFVFIVIIMRVLLFYYCIRNEEREPVWKQGTIDLFATALRQHVLLLVLLTLSLFFIGWITRVSRTVMVFLVFFGIVFDIIFRKLYARYYLSKHSSEDSGQKVLLVCEEEETIRLKHYIEQYGYVNSLKDVHYDCLVNEILTPGSIINFKSVHPVFDVVYISSLAQKNITEEELKYLEQLNIPFCRELSFNEAPLSNNMIVEQGKRAAVFESRMSRKCPVLGVNFTSAAKEESVRYIIDHCRELKGEYICFSNVHTTVMAYDDKQYKNVLNTAAFVMPDGKPIAKEMLKNGFFEAERVAGPDFMDEMFRVTAGTDITHYFYGSTEETISKLREALNTNYPGIKIAGMVSPPFRTLSEEEDQEAIQTINDSKADLIWIGLGAPKQENWMYNHKGKVNGLMLGVGAGFDFHAGTIKRAPVLIQKIGLEWLYRLLQDPKRLFKRYFVTNTKFIWLTAILKK